MNRYFSIKDIQVANKHMKRSSTSIGIREMQVKTTVRFHFTSVRMTAIQIKCEINGIGDVKKLEPSYFADGERKMGRLL